MSFRHNDIRARVTVIRIAQLVLAVVLILGWELAARYGLIDDFFFSRPSDIAVRLADWFGSGAIWRHLSITLTEAALALGIGGAAGTMIGFFLARTQFAAAVFEPYVRMGNALPRVVLAPIFLLWFGLGIWSKVALGVSLVFFIVFFNTYQGVREVDRVLVDNARMLGASERQLLRHVLLPSALTWILASLHLSVGFALIGAVIGEYLGASRGVGYLISQAEGTFDTTGVFAGMTVLCVVVVVVDIAINRVERYLLRWKSFHGTAITKER
ncbi:ABC transporter permease [Nocardia sp. NPDC020380]|uniref:ABC transporter permease n=1 Tax=Nocardia sp. NPDC020380 TaxID=3364309 RepID=UPI0037B48F0D